MRITPVNPKSLGAPRGYSNGMLVSGDCDLLFVAGQIGWNAEQKLVSKRFAEQFDRALKNVLEVVAKADGLPEHVVRLVIYVTDKKEYLREIKDVGAAWRARMGKHYPAMALVEVHDLLEEGAKVEIEAIAALRRSPKNDRKLNAMKRMNKRMNAIDMKANFGLIL